MRRAIVAVLIGTAVFGGIYGLAASMNVSTKTLGAGNTSVAACQPGTLTASYATTYDSTVPGYKVGVVTVSGLASTCYSMPFKVTLTGASNASLSEITGTTSASGATFTADFTAQNVPAANVQGVHVLITG
jgi:hypothetical protein